jgi:hypothetical protein
MPDRSHLDKKYFIDNKVYNCPFCNRRNVKYELHETFSFHWSEKKRCYGYLVNCSDCNGTSMHLSYEDIEEKRQHHLGGSVGTSNFQPAIDIDSKIFYSVPTSFFVIDDRIPAIIRELITEAEGCLKMNFLTGASACTRKAIYEMTVIEKCMGDDYESRIKDLKTKHADVDPSLIDILATIKDMTSEKVHEQSWVKWDSKYLKLIIETLKVILHEIYVVPAVREARVESVRAIKHDLTRDKKKKE